MNVNGQIDPPNPHGGGAMALVIGGLTFLYVLIVLGCAGYLLFYAWNPPPNEALSDFQKLAIAALIGVFGAGLTAMAAIYNANRQSATAYEVEILRTRTGKQLADQNETVLKSLAKMKESSDTKLSEMKANSDESLAKLKVALDVGQVAYRELFGTATTYFYTLRSITFERWDEDALKAAEASMISATQHIIHVENKMRNDWFDFWQRAQEIYREARNESDKTKRPMLIKKLIEEKIEKLDLDLRELHNRIEETARSATATTIGSPGSIPDRIGANEALVPRNKEADIGSALRS